MLRWALIFLVVAILAGIFGFAGIMVAAAGIAKLLFYLFLILFLGVVDRALGQESVGNGQRKYGARIAGRVPGKRSRVERESASNRHLSSFQEQEHQIDLATTLGVEVAALK